MDKSTLEQVILQWAKRDYFNGWGRIFIDEFTKAYFISEEDIIIALKEMGFEFQVLGNIIKIGSKKC